MNQLKIEFEIEKLKEIVDERNRLLNMLQMQPSKNDTLQLKKHLNRSLDLLNEAFNESNFEELANLEISSMSYNDIVDSISDDLIDKSLYHFTKKFNPKEEKRVRFKENLVEEFSSEQPKFKPYKDVEDNITTNNEVSLDKQKQELFGPVGSKKEPKYVLKPLLSNQDLFISQQQQLMEQESHLNGLSGSIQRTHGISMDINDEVLSQNAQLLTDLESQVDKSDGNLRRAAHRLESYEMSSREKSSCLYILILSLILCILLII